MKLPLDKLKLAVLSELKRQNRTKAMQAHIMEEISLALTYQAAAAIAAEHGVKVSTEEKNDAA